MTVLSQSKKAAAVGSSGAGSRTSASVAASAEAAPASRVEGRVTSESLRSLAMLRA
ncbi:hypothetical protein ACFQZC_21660 [Streptacidiphilus monticola]